MGRGTRFGFASTVLAAGAMVLAASATAAFPGTNGKIVYSHNVSGGGLFEFPDLFTVNPDGTGNSPLLTGFGRDFQSAYSADGEKIAFMRNAVPTDYFVWTANADGTGATQIDGTPGVSDRDPYWFPDGMRIAFSRGPSNNDQQIWVMNADGSNQTQLTFLGPNGDQYFDPSVSPDGRRIVLEREDGATGFSEIWVMNADGSGLTPLTSTSATIFDADPDWSPNGERIVFSRYDDTAGNSDLFVMNADGSNQTRITSGPEDDYAPAFSPDGTRVAFTRQDNTGPGLSDIYLTGPDGLNAGTTPVTSEPPMTFDFEPSWQPINPPACDLSGNAKQKSVKSVSVTVTCQNENATVTAEGSGSAAKVPKGATASKKKKFTIPAVSTQVQPNAPTTVTLKIPKKGAKALKKAQKAGKKGKATIVATLTDDLGQSSTATFKVTFKAKRKKEAVKAGL